MSQRSWIFFEVESYFLSCRSPSCHYCVVCGIWTLHGASRKRDAPDSFIGWVILLGAEPWSVRKQVKPEEASEKNFTISIHRICVSVQNTFQFIRTVTVHKRKCCGDPISNRDPHLEGSHFVQWLQWNFTRWASISYENKNTFTYDSVYCPCAHRNFFFSYLFYILNFIIRCGPSIVCCDRLYRVHPEKVSSYTFF